MRRSCRGNDGMVVQRELVGKGRVGVYYAVRIGWVGHQVEAACRVRVGQAAQSLAYHETLYSVQTIRHPLSSTLRSANYKLPLNQIH